MYTPVNNLIENRCAQERAPPERSVASLTGLVTLDLYYLYLCGSIPSIADRSELTETTPQAKAMRPHVPSCALRCRGARLCKATRSMQKVRV